MIKLREVAKMDNKTKAFVQEKLKEREKELEIVKQAVNQIANDLEYDGKIKWEEVDIVGIASKQSYKDIYDGSDWEIEKKIYYVINKDGKIVEVPIGVYKRDSAYNDEWPVSWQKDLYVGDYIGENTLAIVSYYKCIISYRNYERYELKVFLLTNLNVDEIKQILLNKIEGIQSLNKLLGLLARI